MKNDHIIDRYFESVNAEDWDALKNLWAEDAELRAVGIGPRKGRDAIMEFYRGLFAQWPIHHDAPGRRIHSDAAASIEVVFQGTTRSGTELSFDAVDIFDLEDGQISRLQTWYDLAYVRSKLEEAENGHRATASTGAQADPALHYAGSASYTPLTPPTISSV